MALLILPALVLRRDAEEHLFQSPGLRAIDPESRSG
jgi:hypothetical protein